MKRNCPFFFHHGLFLLRTVQSKLIVAPLLLLLLLPLKSEQHRTRSRLTCRSAGPATIPSLGNDLISSKWIKYVEAQDLRCCLGFVHWRGSVWCVPKVTFPSRERLAQHLWRRRWLELSIGFRINGISWWRQRCNHDMNAGHMKVGPVCYDVDEEQRNLGGICNSPRLMAHPSCWELVRWSFMWIECDLLSSTLFREKFEDFI